MAATTWSRVTAVPSRAAGNSGAWQLSLLKLWLTQAGSGRLSSTSSPRQTGLKVLGAGLEMRGAGSGAAFTTGKNSGAAATASTPTARPILIHIRSADPLLAQQITGTQPCQQARAIGDSNANG